jgi:hypothetical protein
MDERRQVWAIGDIHGAHVRLVGLLREAGIIDGGEHWSAGAVIGVCIGDYFNRGETGAEVVTLLRRLQTEARMAGGDLITLLGNHEILMYGVLAERKLLPYGEFASRWLLNGGRFLDLEAMERDQAAQSWLSALPAMALIGETLYLHSDTMAYLELGTSIAAVNGEVRSILQSGDLDRIAVLFDLLCRRGELRDVAAVDRLLATYGGVRVVHGHTPTFSRAPVISFDGRCIAIDGALWASDEQEELGFVFME